MNRIAKWATTVALLAAFGGVVGWSMLGHREQRAIEAGDRAAAQAAAQAQVVTGRVAVDVEPFFADPRVQKILLDHGLTVRPTRAGSREMPIQLAGGARPDFWFPSGVLAATQVDEAGRQAGVGLAQATPFNSPLVVASWTPIAKILVANGVAHAIGERVYGLDMGKLADLMLAHKRWIDLKQAAELGYDVKRSVLVSTTDVRRSNSAAMYLALVGQAINGGEVLTDRAAAQASAAKLAELFRRQGFQEGYVNGNFDDYVGIGIGKAPLAFIYEYQLVGHAIEKKGVQPDMVLMYPEPTIVNKFVMLAATEPAKRLQQLLASDAGLQQAAVAHGLRVADPALFAAAVLPTGLAVRDRVQQVIDPPAYDLMTSMIDTVTAEMAK